MRPALLGLLLLNLICSAAHAQEAAGSAPGADPIVLDDRLAGLISTEYEYGMRCRETILAMVRDQKLITDPKAVSNAMALADRLGAALDVARTQMYAEGLAFEDAQEIDLHFYAQAAQMTARFAQTRQAGDLAVDLRRCPANAAALEALNGGG